MNEFARRWSRATSRALWEHRWLLILVIAALVVRLHWNLVVHPIGDYVYSDMRGYMRRANGLFESGWAPNEYDAFYPYGTHVFLYAVQAVFGGGPDDFTAIGIAYAILGALVVGFGYLVACRTSHYRVVPPIVGVVLVAYYPLIALGGYALSEVPFAFCLVSSTYYLVRMAQDGRKRDAWAAGTLAALGMVVRPQILASIGLLGIFWLVFRKRMPTLRLPVMLHAVLPIVLLLGFSAWRLHHHTGRYGLISENGKFNQVFGRCHNTKIFALPDNPKRRRTSFGPPPLIQLHKREQKLPDAWPGLDPAREVEITYTGYIGDAKILGEIIDDCVQRTGWLKQAEYSLVNVLLLWRYNVAWPDSGKGEWRDYARKWGVFHSSYLAVPALVMAALVLFRRRRATGMALVALHLVALVIVAASIFGDTRLRAPYDPFILLLAVEAYVAGGWLLGTTALRMLRKRRGDSPTHGEATPKPTN
jgi:energy-coupling factor transporter transmembrane protein EcfT